ncbi:hypothetical protein BDW74DRAFT_142943 [Aspergillus multicolor]|uniref:uncharacterized protein n=1 Tax=Aspergillus multicolor TaxID=41759 RepID=UPI003CCE05B2
MSWLGGRDGHGPHHFHASAASSFSSAGFVPIQLSLALITSLSIPFYLCWIRYPPAT